MIQIHDTVGDQRLALAYHGHLSIAVGTHCGPVYFRNGFEMRPAAVTLNRNTGNDMQYYPVDVCAHGAKILDQDGVQLETSAVIRGRRGDVAYTGTCGFAFSGIGMTDGLCYVHYRIAETEIPAKDGLTLSFMMRPMSETGRSVTVDLLYDDGTWLGEKLPALRLKKGKVGAWEKFTYPLPETPGRTIKAVAVVYHAMGEATFAAYLDDICIAEN
ncbi:MAG: hypothetical protein MJ175_13200 [Clostridia bacterium]|nr:hypothetical protein [Clostridia bacterium]